MEINKNLELTRLIGRRLRDCGGDIDDELPATIAGGLAALRETELPPADESDYSRTAAGVHRTTRSD